MSYTRQELGAFSLQRLAYVLPQDKEQEELVQEIFEARAAASSYLTLTSIDVKQGWQETILQRYVDEKRETMAKENPAVLAPEDEALLDSNTITKEMELELQAKLDKKNKKAKLEDQVDEEEPAHNAPPIDNEHVSPGASQFDEATIEANKEKESVVEAPKKGKKGKK